MRVFDCCTRIHFIISTHRSHNKSCAHQFPLTHKANVDVKYFPYSIQPTTTWSKSINSLSDFFLVRTFDEMKMFTFRKWIRFWFLGSKTIACKMVSALSPCKQSLSFSQSLCKYFSLFMTLFSNLFCLFSKIDSVAQRTIIRREFEVFLYINSTVTRHSKSSQLFHCRCCCCFLFVYTLKFSLQSTWIKK